MKFPNYTALQAFVKTELFPASYKDIYEIYTGGSSYNFCVITAKGKYLLKLLQEKNIFLKLKALNQINGTLHETKIEDFGQYKLLLTTYFDGHKLSYKDFSEAFIRRLWKIYQTVNRFKLDQRLIGTQRDNRLQYENIIQLLETTNQDIFTYCYRKLLKIMKGDLVRLSLPLQTIHGDFTTNNILVDSELKPCVIDWGSVRYGYSSEDLSSLILQLSGFRSPVGRMARLKKLFSSINKYAQLSSEEWFYGMQAFYLNLLDRRLGNARKQSFHKRLSLLLILLGYLRVRSFIMKRNRVR